MTKHFLYWPRNVFHTYTTEQWPHWSRLSPPKMRQKGHSAVGSTTTFLLFDYYFVVQCPAPCSILRVHRHHQPADQPASQSARQPNTNPQQKKRKNSRIIHRHELNLFHSIAIMFIRIISIDLRRECVMVARRAFESRCYVFRVVSTYQASPSVGDRRM